ncbi:NEIL3 [Mytilus edulis]|uniref:NEIL3 n=1 Tax=Mytilus edulis TaxID=6550 RepID=A0A8S3TD12_MYTED|nr:NEIL3 [Mytilus edulis]
MYNKGKCTQCDGKVVICRLGEENDRTTHFCGQCQDNNLKQKQTSCSLPRSKQWNFFKETHLDSNITDSDLYISGFETPVRKDRNSHGGGIIMYYKSYVRITRRHDLENCQLENGACKDLPEFEDRCLEFISQIVVSEQDVLDILSTLDVN